MAGDPDDLHLKMRLLAVEVLTGNTLVDWYPDLRDAISVATELLVADRDTPAAVEVACLDATSSVEDARPILREMLTEQGIDVGRVLEDPYPVLLEAFAAGLISAADLESPFYLRLPAWDSQSPIDRRLVVLFDDREHATDPVARAVNEERMRAIVREMSEPEARTSQTHSTLSDPTSVLRSSAGTDLRGSKDSMQGDGAIGPLGRIWQRVTRRCPKEG